MTATQLTIDFAGYHEPTHPEDATYAEQATAFAQANPWLIPALHQLATERLNAGHTRIGVKALIERIRWDYDQHGPGNNTSDSHRPWRLNNNHTAHFARLLIQHHPHLAKHIHTRKTMHTQ